MQVKVQFCLSRLVGRPVTVAQRLASCGEAGCIRIAADTWQLLRCSDAGTTVKSSSWHNSLKLLMGAYDTVESFSYQPVGTGSRV